MKKYLIYLPFCLLLAVLLVTMAVFVPKQRENTETLTESGSSSATASEEPKAQSDEFTYAVWIPYYALTSDSEENFRINYDSLLKKVIEFGANTVIVHVRPYCDAVYNSEYYPVSHIITGKQGDKLSSDPLEYMLKSAHEKGLKFHAWINPLRVKNKSVPDNFAKDSLYTELSEEYPYYFLTVGEGIYLNPAYSYVRRIIADGAAEVAGKYDVDGIQFDDYFYPEDIGEADSADYELYKSNTDIPLSLEEWRLANINSMVAESYSSIKNENEDVLFGISPQGNLENNYGISADVKSWCAVKGYVDYICPQLYFSFDNPALGFIDSMRQWTEIKKHSGLKLWAGLALYKAGTDSDSGTWLGDNNIIAREIVELQNGGFTGVSFFSVTDLSRDTASQEVIYASELLNR